jgi:hypothetical protein
MFSYLTETFKNKVREQGAKKGIYGLRHFLPEIIKLNVCVLPLHT